MSNLDKPRELVFDVFKTEFAGKQPGVPVQYENQKFSQPRDRAWVAISIVPGMSWRNEISSRKGYYHYGVVNVTVLVPEDKGTKQMHDIAQSVFDILCDRDFPYPEGTVTTYGLERRTRGLINGFYVMNVLADYRQSDQLTR